MKVAYISKNFFFVKAVFDHMISGMLVLALLPLFFLIALLVKLEDPQSPILFKQIRIGKNEVPFTMFKFRTMVPDAEDLLEKLLDQNEVEGHMFKMKKDPRVTKIGFYLRKYSLDELPQLFNVLIGDMSLIGPRPSLKHEVDYYTRYERQRFYVKPGCSGLWQVSGRNLLNFDEMIELDLVYINQMSIYQDIKIFFKTIYVVITGQGAF
ncbi:sugar transferase [Enterococcus lactis]|uniref:sugar transferase n=1 Tax=Enterococcus lactis TaxID=357441 RepID=UPI003D95C191